MPVETATRMQRLVVVPMKSLHGSETRAGLVLGNVCFRYAIDPPREYLHMFCGSVAFLLNRTEEGSHVVGSARPHFLPWDVCVCRLAGIRAKHSVVSV